MKRRTLFMFVGVVVTVSLVACAQPDLATASSGGPGTWNTATWNATTWR